MIMEQKFDYSKAIEELEAIAAKVEDPKNPSGSGSGSGIQGGTGNGSASGGNGGM